MNRLVLSSRADKDLAGIADYTIEQFGIEQARHYRNGLEKLFQTLLEYPLQGRPATELAPKLRRIEYQSHSVFYIATKNTIRIVRILHHSMDAQKHL